MTSSIAGVSGSGNASPIAEEIPGSGTDDIGLSTGDRLDLSGHGLGTAAARQCGGSDRPRITEPDGACPAHRWVT